MSTDKKVSRSRRTFLATVPTVAGAAYSRCDAILSPGDVLSGVAHLPGHPATSLRSASLGGGLPRPPAITGRLRDNATICPIAYAFEQAAESKDRHPTMAGLP